MKSTNKSTQSLRTLAFIVLLICAGLAYARAQSAATTDRSLPHFEDYSVNEVWKGPTAAIRIITNSEKMFRTRLSVAAKEPPDFAGHYRFAGWGCGSVCGSGAIIDLQTGVVYPPPLGGKGEGVARWIDCSALFDGTGYEYRVDSRLMVVRCGWNFDAQGKNWPDVYYLAWEGSRFKELVHIRPAKK